MRSVYIRDVRALLWPSAESWSIERLEPRHYRMQPSPHRLAEATSYLDPTFLRRVLLAPLVDFPPRYASLSVLPSSSVTMRHCESPEPPP